MLFSDISFDMNICNSTEIHYALLSRSIVLLFFMLPVFSICHNYCESLFKNLELTVLNYAENLSPH